MKFEHSFQFGCGSLNEIADRQRIAYIGKCS